MAFEQKLPSHGNDLDSPFLRACSEMLSNYRADVIRARDLSSVLRALDRVCHESQTPDDQIVAIKSGTQALQQEAATNAENRRTAIISLLNNPESSKKGQADRDIPLEIAKLLRAHPCGLTNDELNRMLGTNVEEITETMCEKELLLDISQLTPLRVHAPATFVYAPHVYLGDMFDSPE